MFEEEFGLYNENSLDLLLRFPTADQEGEQYPPEALLFPSKELPHTEDLLPCLDLLGSDPLTSEAPCEIQKMREACQEQEVKMFKLIVAKEERPKLMLNLKRKISECTEAPSSPLRKTKPVRKDKP